MFRKDRQPQLNLLELIPHRRMEFDVDEENIVTVKLPRFKHAWMMQNLVPRWKSPYILTKLDRVGSFVWSQCDGSRTVFEIGENMAAEFGEDIQPVHDRLKIFFQQLTQRGYITMHFADGTPVRK